jgi:Zn-dependent peptidase ImmA (M78 family)
MHNINPNESQSVLANLRALVPDRPLSFTEALRIAELQAYRLRRLLSVDDDAFPTELIAELSRLRVVEKPNLPVSGASYWAGGAWVIALNSSEPWQRRRLTMLHEFKHIVDHGRQNLLYRGTSRTTGEQQAEQVADFFAGSVLVPKQLLKSAYGKGLQRPGDLAELFAVSTRAIEVRLAQTGLTEPRRRCPPRSDRAQPGTYFRQIHPAWRSAVEALVTTVRRTSPIERIV